MSTEEKNLNEPQDSALLQADVSDSKKLSIDDIRTYSSWDKIYNYYTRECLNSDGDYSMRFIDWLNINYSDEAPR